MLPLSLSWRHRSHTPLRPAWPEPGKELHRIDFDHGVQPVVGAGLVLLGSSADHAVRALDLETGALRWRFATGELLYANVETHRHWAHGGSRVSVAGDFFFNPSTRGTRVHIRANPNEALPVAFEGTRAYRVAACTLAAESITLTLRSRDADPTLRTAPVLSGMEIDPMEPVKR